MKISVNLASRPYVELRPIYNRLRIWILILLLLGGALWFMYRNERAQAQDALEQAASVQNHVQALERLQQSYQRMMQQPKDAAILKQSDFLNGLFRQKAFSWTATITDLETVLPTEVQVLSLDPIVAKDGQVTIRLRVTGDRDRALDLIRNLEKSRHFVAPRLASETLATAPGGAQGAMQNVDTGNQVNFDILAGYRPLPLPDQAGKEEGTAEAGKNPEEKHGATEPGAREPGAREPRARHGEHRQKLRKPPAGVAGGKPTP